MKQYTLTKDEIFGIPVKKINYNFEIDGIKPLKTPQYIIIHHTGNPNTIQKIINNHVKKKHFTSIGYHILIGKNGQVYYSRDIEKTGAHTFKYNTKAIGIGLFGNFNKTHPTEKQLDSLNKVVDILSKELNIKEVLGHNQAIYKLLKQEKGLKIPELNPIEITNDIKYYSFLKEVDEIVKKYNNDEVSNIFNKLKACPGVNMYKHLKKIEEEII
jgi:hypothetical protein